MGAGPHALLLSGPAGDAGSPVHRLDARAKLVGLPAVAICAVSAPPGAWPVLAGCGLLLAACAAVARIAPAALWRRARGPLLLVLPVAALLPLVRTGGTAWALGPLTVHGTGLVAAATVAGKAVIGIAAAVLLTATTPFAELLRGLQALRVPRLLVLVAGLLHRYAFVVAGEAARMRTALAARGWRPRSAAQAGTVGRLTAALFLRSHARGERVHVAMLARGYDGRLPGTPATALRRADVLVVATVLALLVPLRVLGGAP